MNWLHLVSYFFGGAFLANAIPHSVSGMMGQPISNSFCKAAWRGTFLVCRERSMGMFNVVIGYLLVVRVGNFDLRSVE